MKFVVYSPSLNQYLSSEGCIDEAPWFQEEGRFTRRFDNVYAAIHTTVEAKDIPPDVVVRPRIRVPFSK